MPAALPEWKRHRYMLSCLEKKFPRLIQQPHKTGTLSLVGYGSSLKDTWKDITRPILTMSGAHDFLIERGVVPDFHCDVDPRPHKALMLTPHRGVSYLMGSVCNPLMWERLAGCEVIFWHVVSGPDTVRFLKKWDPGCLLVAGWSCIGLTAIHLAGVLGYDHVELHGYDGSWSREQRTAGPHKGVKHGKIKIELRGRMFLTSRMMANANVELQYLLSHYPVFCVFHGDGYNQWHARHSELPNVAVAGTEKAEKIRTAEWVT